ncbi:MAG: xanthine dehydrogenase family protein subunit M [Gammaproteobacteria bacterium]|nr:xanthine dehydrogenase family protein subunit M [Gammaproteobacteria bacterium]
MQYIAPTTSAAAVAALAACNGDARLLAGGTDILVRLQADLVEPDLLVDIKHIVACQHITEDASGFIIGAAVPSAQLGEHARLSQVWPGIVEGMGLVGSTQVQGRATLTGNLCNASPAADGVPAMVAAGATACVVGPNGTRQLAVEDIPTGPGQISLANNEMIESFSLPPRPPRSSDAYIRFIPRTEMDIAVVGAAVNLTLDETGTCIAACVVLGAVGPTFITVNAAAEALIGSQVDEAALQAVQNACSTAATPISDKRGTAEFRKHTAGVIARRAAIVAHSRALA